MSTIQFAFLITILTALFIIFGAFIGINIKTKNTKFLSLVLGFAGGIMLYLAFLEILPESLIILESKFGEDTGRVLSVVSFFSGIFLISLLDKIIPDFTTMTEEEKKLPFSCLYRVGVFSALTIGIHNIPEGFSTFMASMKSESLGISVGLAIGIHNITVGLAIGIPIFLATKSKIKALFFSSLSASLTVLGGGIAYYFIGSILDDSLFGIVFSLIAGMMVFIALDEILPTAEKYGDHHLVIYGIIGGMLLTAISMIIH